MPNTPALVGEGMTGISYNKEEFTIEERDTISPVCNTILAEPKSVCAASL